MSLPSAPEEAEHEDSAQCLPLAPVDDDTSLQLAGPLRLPQPVGWELQSSRACSLSSQSANKDRVQQL